MIELYLEFYSSGGEEDGTLEIPIETYVVLVVCKYLRQPEVGRDLQINFVQSKTIVEERRRDSITVKLTNFPALFHKTGHWPPAAKYCQLPTLLDNTLIVSGLCGICRRITKAHLECSPLANPKQILGFKGNTLLAPAEISMWTKFCEVDIEKCVRDVLQLEDTTTLVDLPEDIGKLESHLAQPLKAHNIYKLINKVKNVKVSSNQEFQQLDSSDSRFDFHENHKFAEGYEKTLADVIVFACMNLIRKRVQHPNLATKLPLLNAWYERVQKHDDGELLQVCEQFQPSVTPLPLDGIAVDVPATFSLYKSDTKKLNLLGEKILTTNQPEVLGILEKVERLKLDIGSVPNDREENLFDWGAVPVDAKPEGGKLPAKRLAKKQHQLECLANEIIALATPGDIIVDFCSGTGHLGILLAQLLPECTIYLLENKEESQQLAMDRVVRLGLTNVVYFQCNLDYFTARFDVGVSLHACGVATDIVLEKCFEHRARFVSCPCCYGKLYEFDRIRYPRSGVFQRSELLLKEYLCIAHCADQTHDLESSRTNVAKSQQGFFCMDVIDKDRALRAEEFGYSVVVKRLRPENCTPKNRVLVGVLEE
uniref:Glutathione S-transferase C-terminal domain-containing protein homolog n=1 Tax=Culex pipiens TaxID=7175 RepID=A0A8D8CU27_CULPI